jgi:SAM-dependent methyltransferase
LVSGQAQGPSTRRRHKDASARWDSYYRKAGRSVLASRAPPDDESYFADGRIAVLEIIEFVSAPVGGRVIDIGCGDGRLTKTLATISTSVVALDVAPSVLDACRRNLGAADNVEFVLGSVEVLERYPDASADFVISTAVLQHVSSCHTIRSYISEASRLLRPGGVAALQLRDPSRMMRVRDLAVDLGRLATRYPSFRRDWRGCRLDEQAAREAAESADRHVEWRPQGQFAWLVIRAHPSTA